MLYMGIAISLINGMKSTLTFNTIIMVFIIILDIIIGFTAFIAGGDIADDKTNRKVGLFVQSLGVIHFVLAGINAVKLYLI